MKTLFDFYIKLIFLIIFLKIDTELTVIDNITRTHNALLIVGINIHKTAPIFFNYTASSIKIECTYC